MSVPTDLIELVNPVLYATTRIDPNTHVEQFDAIAFTYGSGNTSHIFAERVAAIPSTPILPKPHRSHIDIFVVPFIPITPSAGSRLVNFIRQIVPTNLSFQLTCIHADLIDEIRAGAAEDDAQIVLNPHQQFVRIREDEPATHEWKFIQPHALKDLPTTTTNEINASSSLPSSTPSPLPSPIPTVSMAVSPSSSPSPSPSASPSASPSSSAAAAVPSSTIPVVHVGSLQPCHAPLIIRWWPYSSPSTSRLMPYLIDHLPNRCVYVNHEPVCWIQLQQYGGLGMLHTLDEYRGLGFARQCVNSLCEELFQLGEIPFCYIGSMNIPSQKVFASLGFRPTHYVEWVTWVPQRYLPTLPKESH